MTKITFIAHDGQTTSVDAQNGDVLMRVAQDHNICGIEAECGGSMMCATCHVYIDEKYTHTIGDRVDGESDMLEWAKAELKVTSRLSCQIIVSPEMEGLIVHLPERQV